MLDGSHKTFAKGVTIMKPITPEDWGRIYAYIWKDALMGAGGDYKKRFERDPAAVVKEIAGELGIDYYDCLFEVPEATDFTNSQLDAIVKGTDTTSFKFFLRLTC